MRISYTSAPHPSLLLSCHLNCPRLDCVDSCSAGPLIRRWLSRAFGIATFQVCLTFSRTLLFLAQIHAPPISRVCLMAYSLHTVHGSVSVQHIASRHAAVTGVLQPPFFSLAASISVMSVWIMLMDSLCLRSAGRASRR